MKRLTSDLLQPGQPIPVDIHNRAGRLLVKAGSSITSERLFRELCDFGFIEGDPSAVTLSGKPSAPADLLPQLGVLIADDTALMLDMLEKSLRGLGVEHVARAENGELAVEKTRRYVPDMLFLDIDMPRRDGISALREIREEFPELFVCMLSAHSSVQNVRGAMSAGASAFLVKPFQTEKLKNVLFQYAKRHGAEEVAP